MASSSTVALPSNNTNTSSSSSITLTRDAIPPSPSQPQPHTTVITTIPSTPNTVATGSLLALNDNYIVYAVKNGLIRVMDRTKSNLRTLLRGHEARITDASFFGTHDAGGGSDILASIGGNGNSDGSGSGDGGSDCRIWRIFGNSTDRDAVTEISSEMLLEIRMNGLERVVWHPFNPNQFMLLHNKHKGNTNGNGNVNSQRGQHVATFVETTRLMTTVKDGEGHAVCDIVQKENELSENGAQGSVGGGGGYVHVDGMLPLIISNTNDDAAISDLTFSQDARYVLTAHEDGCVRLWDLSMSGKYMTVPVSSPEGKDGTGVGVGVKKCFFLSAFGDVKMNDNSGDDTATAAAATTSDPHITHPFVTCTKHGKVTLWSPFCASGKLPTKVASFQAHSDGDGDGDGWNCSVCTLPHGNENGANATAPAATNPPSTFVILSNDKGAIHALHMASQWKQTSASGSTTATAIVTGFDYVAFFQSLQAIHSQSVISSPDDSINSSDARMWNLDLYCVQSKAVQKLTLSPAMCAAPPPLQPGVVPNGIVVTVLGAAEGSETGTRSAEDGADDDHEHDHDAAEFVDYDDYEDIEEEEEDDDHDEEDEEDEEEEIDTSNVPPPPLPGFPEANNNNSSRDKSPFANWLGNLAAANSQKAAAPVPAPTPVPVPIPTASEFDLADLPLPEEPDILPESAPVPPPPESLSVPADPEAPQQKQQQQQQQQELLSPMQILGLAPKKSSAKEVTKQLKAEKFKEKKNSTSSKSNNGGVHKSSSKTLLSSSQQHQQQQHQPVPIPNKGGKIAILKREDPVSIATKKQTSTIVPMDGGKSFSSSAPSAGNGSGNGSGTSITKDDVEDIIRRAVSSHFHKQEQFITAEIQKAVRYEVQSGVVPALNKTVAQTLEQTVSKSMKTNVTKTIKECMKANTSEMIQSLSAKLEEPLVDGFHQSMKEIMIPAYESGTRQMFEQISSSIEVGLELKEKENIETAKLMDGMVKRMDAMGKTIEVLIKAVAQLQGAGGAQPATAAQRGGGAGTDVSRNTQVNEEELLRAKIIDLIRAKEYEKAFTAALTVSNSAMALFVVKHSNLSVVIEGDTPALSQPIMLCLMQQLGADLSTDENLPVKLAWLQSIAVTLDPFSESIKRHIQGVVQQLVTNLHGKMQESDPTLRRHLQMLVQVIRGIGTNA